MPDETDKTTDGGTPVRCPAARRGRRNKKKEQMQSLVVAVLLRRTGDCKLAVEDAIIRPHCSA